MYILSLSTILNARYKNIKYNDRKLVHDMVRRSSLSAKFYNAPLFCYNCAILHENIYQRNFCGWVVNFLLALLDSSVEEWWVVAHMILISILNVLVTFKIEIIMKTRKQVGKLNQVCILFDQFGWCLGPDDTISIVNTSPCYYVKSGRSIQLLICSAKNVMSLE